MGVFCNMIIFEKRETEDETFYMVCEGNKNMEADH
jgi:hypothetical protein